MLAANPSRDGTLIHSQEFGGFGLRTEMADQTGEGCVHNLITQYGYTHNDKHGDTHLQGYGRAHDNERMEFKDRLKLARKRLKMSQAALADAVGLDQTSISDLERGKSHTTSFTVQIAHALRVDPRWLATGQGSMLTGRDQASGDDLEFHDTEIIDEEAPLAPDEIELPCFREVEFAAGDGRTQVIENHGAYMRFSLARLSRAGVNPDQAACATLSGTSMEPTIADGSPIGIDKGTRHIIDGKIYALDHGGMLRVKRLYKMPLNRVRIVSDNADEYPEEVCSLGHQDAPQIIGRVFWWEVFD